MLSIGEFAGLTGLSVKALRHYDDKGVLTPLEVDDVSGYRRYGEAQVRAGVLARALRDAGVPLPAVADALEAGTAREALTEHRQRVLAERAREDQAFTLAEDSLAALAVPVTISERQRPAQAFVAQVITVSNDSTESVADEGVNEVFRELFEQLQSAGIAPCGQFWTSLRAGVRGTVDVICCWPTSELIAVGHSQQFFAASLPARTELVATWRPTSPGTSPDGLTHPGVVALFDALAHRQIDLRDMEVRQEVHGHGDDDYAVEISVSLPAR